VWSACSWGVEHAVDPVGRRRSSSWFAQVRRGVDQTRGCGCRRAAARSYQDGAAPAPVSWGWRGRNGPSRGPGRGTPPEKPQPRMVTENVMAAAAEPPRHLVEQTGRSSPSSGRAILVGGKRRASLPSTLATSTTIGRVRCAWPAEFAGGEIRRVGLDQDAGPRGQRGRGWRAARRNA